MAWDKFALWRGAAYWYNKGVDLHRSGDYEKAIQCYDRALEKDPGYTLAKDGREDALRKKDTAPKSADAWNNKGNALADLGRYDEAIQCYDRALEIDPEDAYA